MVIVREKNSRSKIRESTSCLKSFRRNGAKFQIVLEGDFSKGISTVEKYDASRYDLAIGQDTHPDHVLEAIAICLGRQAWNLATNDDHDLAVLLSSN